MALLLQIKRMTRICGLSSLAASFKLLILKQDKQRINNLAEHRQPGSSQVKGSRETSAASSPPHPQQPGDSFAPSPNTLSASPCFSPLPCSMPGTAGGQNPVPEGGTALPAATRGSLHQSCAHRSFPCGVWRDSAIPGHLHMSKESSTPRGNADPKNIPQR